MRVKSSGDDGGVADGFGRKPHGALARWAGEPPIAQSKRKEDNEKERVSKKTNTGLRREKTVELGKQMHTHANTRLCEKVTQNTHTLSIYFSITPL